jgi:hypothetical protein
MTDCFFFTAVACYVFNSEMFVFTVICLIFNKIASFLEYGPVDCKKFVTT